MVHPNNTRINPRTDAGTARPLDVVLVADPHPLLRAGLRTLLERAELCRVTVEAVSMATLLYEVRRTRPDVVIADLDLPGAQQGAGLAEMPAPVLLVGDEENTDRIVAALSARVRGFVGKTRPAGELLAAIRTVAAGFASLPPVVTSRLLDSYLTRPADPTPPPVALTRREQDVLQLMAEGRSTGQIAELLVVRTSTVKTHIYHLLHKLGAGDRVQAVAFAYRHGLVSTALLSNGRGEFIRA